MAPIFARGATGTERLFAVAVLVGFGFGFALVAVFVPRFVVFDGFQADGPAAEDYFCSSFEFDFAR